MIWENQQDCFGDADLKDAVQSLGRYARDFFLPVGRDRVNMFLKLDHCLRVFREAGAIAASEGLTGEMGRTAVWAALFHDIGRFPQYARYATFDDRKSVNHGRLGVRVLKQRGFLRFLDQELQKIVLAAVILHNCRFLPPGLPDRFAVPTKVVRDADKLDIFAVMLAHLRPDAAVNHVVTLGLCDNPAACSPEIVSQIMRGCLADYTKMVWLNDFRLLLCSWIYDLNFTTSRKMVLERGYVEKLLAPLPDTPDIRLAAKKVRADLRALAAA
ncbi:MAG TPA: HD domain-containing protein [Desulfonatronum sp.]|nr:HD domain-containing protein [Desulfonatronum sp.]